MKLENPWVQAACADSHVAANTLPTYLQEQYGQLAEDLILEAVLKSYFAREGLPLDAVRYLEVGANHPIQTSNTYLFSRKWGGQGWLVEANPELIDALARVRPRDLVLDVAVVPPGYPETVDIHLAANAELSSVDADHVQSFGAIGGLLGRVPVATITLDELLERHCSGGLHLMSIDIEGLDLEVLARSRLPKRPVFVVTEPSRHYRADAEAAFAEVMAGHGYVEVARTDYNLIYCDRQVVESASDGVAGAAASTARSAPGTTARATSATTSGAGPATVPSALQPRRKLRSFDVFDTLIARRCMHPLQVFLDMERRSGIAGLAQQRVAAERRVQLGPLASSHGLGDIYRELAAALGLDAAQAEALAQIEIQVELDNVIPIADNIARLDAESLLVSDMYLPDAVIRALLKRAGVGTDLPLLRSTDGKASGRLWAELAAQGVQCQHLGDNARSDVAQACAAGMRAELTSQHAPTNFEQEMYLRGLPHTAMALRAARLATPGAGLPDWLRRLQGELNLPTLLVAAMVALTHARGEGLNQLCFASRDGRGLQAMADVLIANGGFGGLRTRYWHTSRLARSSADAAYLDFCRELFGVPSLLIDLCGTGTSVTRLLEALRLDHPPRLFVAEHVHAPAHVREMRGLYGMQTTPTLPRHVFDTRSYVDNVSLEMLNYACEGMVRGVARVGELFLPVRDPIDLDGEALALAGRQQAYLSGLIGNFGRELAESRVLAELTTQLPAMAELLHARLGHLDADLQMLHGVFGDSHNANETALKLELARRAARADLQVIAA